MCNVKANKHSAARDAMAQYRKGGEEEHMAEDTLGPERNDHLAPT